MHARVETKSFPAFLTAHPDGVTLAVKVTPRARRDEIDPAPGPELRVKVTAPPVDAAANAALLRLLAAKLGCPRSAVQIVRGHASRHKLVKLHGVSAAAVMAKLASD